MENNNLSILGDRHTIIIFPTTPTPSSTIISISSSIGIVNLQYQPLAKDQPPSIDLVISCCFIIGIISHRQSPLSIVITFSRADLGSTICPDTCKKWCQQGHKFILVATDYFTKWVETIPLKKVASTI